jgi:hypothetical protein
MFVRTLTFVVLIAMHAVPLFAACDSDELHRKRDRAIEIMTRLTAETADPAKTGRMPICYVIAKGIAGDSAQQSTIRESIDEKASLESELHSCGLSKPSADSITTMGSYYSHLASYTRECNGFSDLYLDYISQLRSSGVSRVSTEAFESLRLSVRNSMAEREKLADLYEGKARALLNIPASQDYVPAMFSLAFIFSQQESNAFDRNRAIDLWARAADIALKNGDRDIALKALSHIEYLDKAHPSAERLRHLLFN